MSSNFSFSETSLVEKVKLKLNFVDYDGDITIPDQVVEKHLETAKALIDSVCTEVENVVLYEECLTEYAKYTLMVSWAANAIDIEKTPGTWATILKNELRILRTLLLQLIGDEYTVNQLLGEEQTTIQEFSVPRVTYSYNMINKLRRW